MAEKPTKTAEKADAMPDGRPMAPMAELPEGNLPATTNGNRDPGLGSYADTLDQREQAAQPQQPQAQRGIGRWEDFQAELNKRADEIATQLPKNVSKERFMNASIAAVKATPEILTATPRSLFGSLVKAAQDGLLPDGREGIITVYNVTGQGMTAQWNPMMLGIRKRARELGDILIDAQVVYDGDEFDYLLGDEPRIFHKPHQDHSTEWVGQDKGIAAYAIFRQQIGKELIILHREVMWGEQIRRTQAQSRAKTSLMWTGFWTEGWRKTVLRRGSKSVPVTPEFERLIQREDDNFDFAADNAAISHRDIGARLAAGTPITVNTVKHPQIAGNAPPAADQVKTEQTTAQTDKTAPAKDGEGVSVFEQTSLDELAEAATAVTTPEGLGLLAEEWQPTIDLMGVAAKLAAAKVFLDHPAAAAS